MRYLIFLNLFFLFSACENKHTADPTDTVTAKQTALDDFYIQQRMYFYNYAAAVMFRHFQCDPDGFREYEKQYKKAMKDTNIIQATARFIDNDDLSIFNTCYYKTAFAVNFKPYALLEEGFAGMGGAPVTLVANDSTHHNDGIYTRYCISNSWVGELTINNKTYPKALKLSYLGISIDSLEQSGVCDVYVKRFDDYPINPRFAVPPNTETDMFELFKKGHYRDSTGQIPLISKSFKK